MSPGPPCTITLNSLKRWQTQYTEVTVLRQPPHFSQLPRKCLLRPLPFLDHERLAMVGDNLEGAAWDQRSVTAPESSSYMHDTCKLGLRSIVIVSEAYLGRNNSLILNGKTPERLTKFRYIVDEVE